MFESLCNKGKKIIKKRLQYKCFSINIAKFFRTIFLSNTFGSCFLKLCFKPVRTSPWRTKKAFTKLLWLLYWWLGSCSQWGKLFLLLKWPSKTSWKRLCECETSLTIVCMCCDKFVINKRHKVHRIYTYR